MTNNPCQIKVFITKDVFVRIKQGLMPTSLGHPIRPLGMVFFKYFACCEGFIASFFVMVEEVMMVVAFNCSYVSTLSLFS